MRKLTVRAKLSISLGIMAFLMAVMAVSSLLALDDANERLETYVNGVNARASLAIDVRSAVNQRAIAARNLVLVTQAEDVAQEKAAVLAAQETVATKLAELQKQAAEANLPPRVRQQVTAIADIEAKYGPVATRIVSLALSGDQAQAIASMNTDCRPLLKALLAAVNVYVDFSHERAREMIAAAESAYARQRAILLGLCLFAFVTASGLGWSLVRSLWRALGSEPAELNEAALRVASGDLSPIAHADKAPANSVLAALGVMQRSLAQIVGQVRNSSDSIATGSNQIASGSTHLSQRTEEQATSLVQAAASMSEIRSTVERNADTAREAKDKAALASQAAHAGGNVMREVITTMQDITTSSRKVADIISVIDGIAFQTNILALNAAVEAARAGEQGRGFAIVAGEVRTLAQRSAGAAKEIRSLIGASVERVESGSRLVEQAGTSIQGIVQQVGQVAELIADISASAVDQTTTIGQMASAVTQLDQVTQHNAALVEESTAAAESLRHQASALTQMVGQFKLRAWAA